MTLNFPTNPTDGQPYTYNGLGWQWSQSTGAWTATSAINQKDPIIVIPGTPWFAYIAAGDSGTIYTASQDSTTSFEITIRAEGAGTGGAEDVTEISRVAVAKSPNLSPAAPVATVYGQVTNDPAVSFTHYDVALDIDNNLMIIADTAPHGASRKFTYQVTEYGA